MVSIHKLIFEQATPILSAVGGQDFQVEHNSVTCRVGRGRAGCDKVRVSLTRRDEYEIEFLLRNWDTDTDVTIHSVHNVSMGSLKERFEGAIPIVRQKFETLQARSAAERARRQG